MEIQSLLILFTLVLLCMLTFMCAVLLCYRNDTRVAATTTTETARSSVNRNTIGSMISAEREETQGIHPEIIKTFHIIPYKSIKTMKNVKGRHGCAVCLSEFENQDMLRMLPGCCHVFHPDCIGAWLYSNATCPVCRSDLSDPAVLTSDHCMIGEEKEPVVTEMRELEDRRSLKRASSVIVRWSSGRSGRWDTLIKTLSGRSRKDGDSKRIAPLFMESITGSRDVEMGTSVTSSWEN